MEWKELSQVGAAIGCVGGTVVTCLWAFEKIKVITRILFSEDGELRVMTSEKCEDCRKICAARVDAKIDGNIILLKDIKESIELSNRKNDNRHDISEKRMQRLISINAGTANFMRVIAERRKADENTAALDLIIERVEKDIEDLAG